MKTTIKFLGLLLAGSLLTTQAFAGPVLTNGSLTGPISNGGVPSGWTVINPSPDTMDENNNVGGSYGGFAATPSASADGGTWVGFADNPDSNFQEVFGQTVSGFTVGSTYTVGWYQANFGYSPFGYVNDDFIGLFVDGILAGKGGLNVLGNGWTSASVNFIATSSTQTLSFGVGDEAGRSYLSIDGITLAEATVPEPEALILISLGILGLASSRRRRIA